MREYETKNQELALINNYTNEQLISARDEIDDRIFKKIDTFYNLIKQVGLNTKTKTV